MRKYIYLIPILLSIALPLSAESLTLTLEEAAELARSNNFNLKVQRSSVATKARAKDDAWNAFIPDVSAGLTLNRGNNAQTISGTSIMGIDGGTGLPTSSDGIYDELMLQSYQGEMDPWTLAANVSVQLVLSPALKNGITQLDLEYRNALLNLKTAEMNTELGIKKSFYQILLMEEQIKVFEKNIQTTQNRLDSMREMYRHGYVTELDLLKTEAALSSLGPGLSNLKNSLELMLLRFKMDLGLDLDVQILLEGSVEASAISFDEDELVEKYLPGRLDIQQLRLNREMLENAKSATFNQSRMPSLILSWSYSPYQADPFNLDSWGSKGLSGDNGAFSLTVSFPIEGWLPHSRTDNKLKETQEEIERLDYQRELAVRGAEMEIRSLVMSLNTSLENLAVLEESVSINQESLAMSQEAYNSGAVTLLDLETAATDFLRAEINLLAEKYNYISILLDLEAAVNQQLESSGY